MRTNHNRLAGACLALGLIASACTSDGGQNAADVPDSLAAGEAGGVATSDASSTTSAAAASSTAPTTAVTTTSAPTTSAAKNSSTTTAAVGGPYDIGPPQGQAMDVVGVAFDDVLNFRAAADPGSAVVDTAAPFSTSPAVVSEGTGWLLAGSAWWNVTVDGQVAWANTTYLGVLGQNSDITGDLATSMPSLSAPDLQTLAQKIGNARSGGPTPLVVFSVEPVAADAQGGEATIDVIGLGDDAVKGERIFIAYRFVFDDINAASPTVIGFDLTYADAQAICARGISGGLCL